MDAESAGRAGVEKALDEALVGARLDEVRVDPELGLVALGVFAAGQRRALVVGVGPGLWGLGLSATLPRKRAGAAHPVLAALRAHALEHRVRSVVLEGDALWLALGGNGVSARVKLLPGRRGEVEVLSASGERVLRWAPGERGTGTAAPYAWPEASGLEKAGDELVARAEAAAQARRKQALVSALYGRLKALTRREEAVRADLARLDDVESLQRRGRLLLGQSGKVQKGATSVELEDWELGGTVVVELSPTVAPKAQAERYFQRARRLQRGAAAMQKRLDQTADERAKLGALRERVEAAKPDDERGIETLEREAHAQGVRGAGAGAAGGTPGGKKQSARRPFHTFRDARGRAVLVGRGGADNDLLTTRFARPHDLWMHVKDNTGAHVVVPLEKGHACPPELLVDAATLAAHFSSVRGSSVADVAYVERRYVRKPRGSAVGSVVLDREKVLAVRVEPERLERLLASKEEG